MFHSIKQFSKVIISSLLYYTGALNRCRSYMKQSQFPLILYYHRVRDFDETVDVGLSISVENFENQIQYLKKNYNIVPLDSIVKKMRNVEPSSLTDIAITFDDGYKDNYENAYPILKRYNVQATIFLTTDYIGTNKLLWWDKLIFILSRLNPEEFKNIPFRDEIFPERIKYMVMECVKNIKKGKISLLINELKSLGSSKREFILNYLEENYGERVGINSIPRTFMSWDEIKEMSNNGVSFGSHTCTHSVLTEISYEKAREETIRSKRIIEEKIGKKVSAFAYPDGCLSDKIKNIVEKSGYLYAVQTFRGKIYEKADLFSISRKMIKEGHSKNIFRKFSKSLFTIELSGALDQLLLRKSRTENPYEKNLDRI